MANDKGVDYRHSHHFRQNHPFLREAAQISGKIGNQIRGNTGSVTFLGGKIMNRWWKHCISSTAIVGLLGSLAWAVDTDHDGVDDALDVCCATPANIPVDEHGRPLGDLDLDCDVDLQDAALFWGSYTGILPYQTPCQGDDDENQCALGTDNCSVNATCTDTSFGFTCTCNPGFAGNGVQCQDVNECLTNPCAGHGTCTNQIGGYTCTCSFGYVEGNGTCLDVNECADEGICGDAGECVNQPGTYACDCNPGYANCDGKPDCEVRFGLASNTCPTATYVGSACGDLEKGLGCPDTNYSQFNVKTGRGSAWFRAHVDECSPTCCADLEHRYVLTVPAGADYDLYVYTACNGDMVDSSTNGQGVTDTVTPARGDDCGIFDNGGDFLIEVRYFNGSSCANWTLTFEGRD